MESVEACGLTLCSYIILESLCTTSPWGVTYVLVHITLGYDICTLECSISLVLAT
jgi:hypothetical protein